VPIGQRAIGASRCHPTNEEGRKGMERTQQQQQQQQQSLLPLPYRRSAKLECNLAESLLGRLKVPLLRSLSIVDILICQSKANAYKFEIKILESKKKKKKKKKNTV
jgi:hypothetical protein